MCRLRAGTALPAMKRVFIQFHERQLGGLARVQALTGATWTELAAGRWTVNWRDCCDLVRQAGYVRTE